MPVDVSRTLRVALAKLQAEKRRIDHQIVAIESVLDSSGAPRGREARRGPGRSALRGRGRMSAAARRAVSARMKAYWRKRRAESKKRESAKKK